MSPILTVHLKIWNLILNNSFLKKLFHFTYYQANNIGHLILFQIKKNLFPATPVRSKTEKESSLIAKSDKSWTYSPIHTPPPNGNI